MAITHNRLKEAVKNLVSTMYSDRGVGATADNANKLSELCNFYKGDILILSGILPNTLVTPLSLFDDSTVRTELFISNDDSTKILSLYLDNLGNNLFYTLEPKDSITFPAYFLESVYIKASAPSLAYTSWAYVIPS